MRPTGASHRMESERLAALPTAISELLGRRGRLAANALIAGLLLALLVVAASATSALPLWPVLALTAAAAAAVITSIAARRRRPGGWLRHLLDAFGALGRSPRRAAALLGWVAASIGGHVAPAAAVAAALGVHAPLSAALVVVPALALAGIVQLTPANLGVTGAAVALVLQSNRYLLGRLGRRRSRPPERARRQDRSGEPAFGQQEWVAER